ASASLDPVASASFASGNGSVATNSSADSFLARSVSGTHQLQHDTVELGFLAHSHPATVDELEECEKCHNDFGAAAVVCQPILQLKRAACRAFEQPARHLLKAHVFTDNADRVQFGVAPNGTREGLGELIEVELGRRHFVRLEALGGQAVPTAGLAE